MRVRGAGVSGRVARCFSALCPRAAMSAASPDGADSGANAAEDGPTEMIGMLSNRRIADRDVEAMGGKMRDFYARQNSLIDAFMASLALRSDAAHNGDSRAEGGGGNGQQRSVNYFVSGSFASNVVLFLIKLATAIASKSVVVLASTIDSALDLVSALVMFWSNRASQRASAYKYPQGRRRLEPVGIIVFACIMSVTAAHVVMDAGVSLVTGLATEGGPRLDGVGPSTFWVLGAVVAVKSLLWAVGSALRQHSESAAALATDHRNDTLSNSVSAAVLAVAASVHSLWWADPVAGILMALFIVYTWAEVGGVHVRQLTGVAAPPEVISRIAFLAANHDARIRFVDTVRAYYAGTRVFAEVDIGLDPDMPLRVAHDIGEGLQRRIEQDPAVERAFVHADYEAEHNPHREHLPV